MRLQLQPRPHRQPGGYRAGETHNDTHGHLGACSLPAHGCGAKG
jgi:hypothetical protein